MINTYSFSCQIDLGSYSISSGEQGPLLYESGLVEILKRYRRVSKHHRNGDFLSFVAQCLEKIVEKWRKANAQDFYSKHKNSRLVNLVRKCCISIEEVR